MTKESPISLIDGMRTGRITQGSYQFEGACIEINKALIRQNSDAQSMIERVAKSICRAGIAEANGERHIKDAVEKHWYLYKEKAKAAIAAMGDVVSKDTSLRDVKTDEKPITVGEKSDCTKDEMEGCKDTFQQESTLPSPAQKLCSHRWVRRKNNTVRCRRCDVLKGDASTRKDEGRTGTTVTADTASAVTTSPTQQSIEFSLSLRKDFEQHLFETDSPKLDKSEKLLIDCFIDFLNRNTPESEEAKDALDTEYVIKKYQEKLGFEGYLYHHADEIVRDILAIAFSTGEQDGR